MAIKIVEFHCVSPAAGAGAEQSLPLVYFDMIWLHSPPAETLYFYHTKYSESYFLETIVPMLIKSLSIALKYYLPLASNIIFPLTSATMPVARYADGDSLPLTIATSDADFPKLTANHSKTTHEFRQFVPQMPTAVYSSDNIKFKAATIQVTLFPNEGICVGVTDHHAISDGASLFSFLRTWASIHQSNCAGEYSVLDPFYGRDSVQESDKLSAFVWEQVKTSGPSFTRTISSPSHKVRSTFILSDGEMKKLKNGMSTFVAICAHIWSCLATSAAAAGEVVQDDVQEYLTSPVDCRRRLNPPLPENYFGNCLVFLRARCSHGRLKGDGGFLAAADAIAAAVKEAGQGILEGFKRKPESFSEWKSRNRVIPISGSPRLDPCARITDGEERLSMNVCIQIMMERLIFAREETVE
ncbi:hypothetical protein SASPL_112609 [Salvia splendens]|uniref:Uncharacterized protein n=1 Tax=Salvia splendens TaxID=180675 RepID=A0A8X8YEU2_SALSN|nr:malonyl-coenzyme:anthocyanin 5-O-glucoside-6'''-O-malonyltransferase-like [Salvia splendens]KAG6428358.1 hypothetical protein SASPL_112609 [Salvia splendens]